MEPRLFRGFCEGVLRVFDSGAKLMTLSLVGFPLFVCLLSRIVFEFVMIFLVSCLLVVLCSQSSL